MCECVWVCACLTSDASPSAEGQPVSSDLPAAEEEEASSARLLRLKVSRHSCHCLLTQGAALHNTFTVIHIHNNYHYSTKGFPPLKMLLYTIPIIIHVHVVLLYMFNHNG